jgi:hypothetical protein
LLLSINYSNDFFFYARFSPTKTNHHPEHSNNPHINAL